MPIQYINTGTAPNQGNGDTLRTAFTKINNNFDVLFNNLAVSDTVGEVITHSELHRGIAVTYNSSTQQASFLVNIASTSTLGGVKIGSGITVDPVTGVISAASSSFDGNYNSLSNIPQALGINDSPSFAGLTSTGTIYQGTAYDGVDFSDTSIRVDADVDSFAQMIMKNHNSGTSASTDLVIMNNQGTDTENFIDLGINSSNYTVQQYSSTQPNDGYLFVNGGNLVIGTQTPNKKIVFHAGGTANSDSTAFFDEYAWQFNRQVTIDVDRPVPLNFTVINRSSNVVAQALFQAQNNLGNLVHFGINSSHPEAFYGRIGPNEAFLHLENSTSTLHIGSYGDVIFYSDLANGFAGTPTLVMSSIDQSSTFNGHLLPTTDLAYDLGSTSSQWRSLYVGTSTVYFGGIPMRVTAEGGITVNDIAVSGSSNQLVSTQNSNTLSITTSGDVVFSGEIGGVNRGLVWDYGAEAGGINSMVRQDMNGLTVRAWTESDEEGIYAAPVNIVTNQDADQKTWSFDSGGVLTLPQGGVITETEITGNPTVVIAPANPEIESQVLFIKGGAPGFSTFENDIGVNTEFNQYSTGSTVSINVFSPNNANSTLFWWLDGVDQVTPTSGTVVINEFGASDFPIEVTVTTTEPFRIYIGPTDGVTATAGVTVSINGEVVTDYHLHLTTGDLTETSIFLGTDDHNVRTTTDGGVEINTILYSGGGGGGSSGRWIFDNYGDLTFPGGVGKINSAVTSGPGLQVEADSDFEIKVAQTFDAGTPEETTETAIWSFESNGSITFPDNTVQTTAYIGGVGGSSDSLVNGEFTVSLDATGITTFPGNLALLNGAVLESGFNGGPGAPVTNLFSDTPVDGIGSQINVSVDNNIIGVNNNGVGISVGSNDWYFGSEGTLTFPDETVQTTAYVPEDNLVKVSDEWTVTTGTNTYSFTLPSDGTYVMWVKGNIPNGIIIWNATVSVSNSNVPAIGTQYAWNYTGGGSPILLTAIPDQIKGTAGGISTDATYVGSTSNRFDFTIANTSGESQTVYYGYTKV